MLNYERGDTLLPSCGIGYYLKCKDRLSNTIMLKMRRKRVTYFRTPDTDLQV